MTPEEVKQRIQSCKPNENVVLHACSDGSIFPYKARGDMAKKINELASVEWLQFNELAEEQAYRLVCEACPRAWPECGEDCDTYLVQLKVCRWAQEVRN